MASACLRLAAMGAYYVQSASCIANIAGTPQMKNSLSDLIARRVGSVLI